MRKFQKDLRKNIKEIISILLSLVLILGTLAIPAKVTAAGGTTSGRTFTFSATSTLSSGEYLFPGDVLSPQTFTESGTETTANVDVLYKIRYPGPVSDHYTRINNFTENYTIPASIGDSEYNSYIYYASANAEESLEPTPGKKYWGVTLDAFPGFQIIYHDVEGNVINEFGSQYFFCDYNEENLPGLNSNLTELDITLAEDDTLGVQRGWSSNPDYIDSATNSGDYFTVSEEGPAYLEYEEFWYAMSSVQNGILNLYPIFDLAPSTLSVKADNYEVGGELPLTINTNRKDEYKLSYEKKNSDGTFTELSAAPTTAGNYRVTVSFTASDTQIVEGEYGMEIRERGYTEISDSAEYSIISSASLTTKPAAKTLVYNGSSQALVSEGSATGGTVNYSLSKDGEYSTTIPSAKDAGKYTVWYMVKGTDGRSDISPASIDVTISPKTVGLSWSGTKYEYDGASHCPSATATGLLDGDSCDVTVTGAQKEAGTYTAKASALSNSNYALPNANTTQFIITKDGEVIDQDKLKGSVNVSMEGFYYGGKQTSPVITSTTNDVKGAKVSYKAAGSADSTYSPSVPTEAGKYIVKVTLPANDKYNACSATAEFSISYLPVPDNAYYIGGTKGSDNWYKSEVSITPGAGYQLSYGDRNHFSNNGVKIEKSVNQVFIYVRDASTYEQTDVITIAGFKIDTKSPKVEDMESGEVYFADESGNVTCVVSDENLSHVVIDGNKVKLNDLGNGRKSFTVPAGAKKETVSFTAYDLAGNKTDFSLITAPSWKKDGVIKEGEIYLESGEKFTIPEGKWTVEGDSTVYFGGSVFYAAKEGLYTFKKQ
ncbi:MAG: hypothetical protein J6X80_08280 [Lachnospiraceae bacterium]|nr:hypothetical protein [Lachnospiraceae bacterium]